VIEFWVSGRPAPQGSKRHVGNGRMIEMSKAVGPWREAVRGEAQRVNVAAPLAGPVRVSASFFFIAPKSTRRATPHVRPDLDKLIRAVLDGLTMAGVFGDDGQVTEIIARKSYGARPGAMIRVAPAPASAHANATEEVTV
jgi:crossover junction endodeoxyribonuclease RusA